MFSDCWYSPLYFWIFWNRTLFVLSGTASSNSSGGNCIELYRLFFLFTYYLMYISWQISQFMYVYWFGEWTWLYLRWDLCLLYVIDYWLTLTVSKGFGYRSSIYYYIYFAIIFYYFYTIFIYFYNIIIYLYIYIIFLYFIYKYYIIYSYIFLRFRL